MSLKGFDWTGGLPKGRAILSWLVCAAMTVVLIWSPLGSHVTGIITLAGIGVLFVLAWPRLTRPQ